MFLQIIPPQDTPHDCRHAHQMALKTHPDRKNRPRCSIPARLHKRTDISNMHRYCGKTSLSMSVPELWHHTQISRIYHQQWGRNRPWEKYPRRHAVVRDKPTVASLTLTYQGRLPSWFWTTSQGRPDRSGYRGKGGLNGWIYWWHHNHYHWRPIMGGARQERSFIDHPHHIQTSAVLQTPEMRWPPLTPQTRGRRTAYQA